MNTLNNIKPETFEDTGTDELRDLLQASAAAFVVYRKQSPSQRAHFMRAVAAELDHASGTLIEVANAETNLGEERLKTELLRTMFQLRSYADACERGQHLDLRIDTATSKRPSLRKMNVPLGPVAVFGAANFPFAYSTAGGDTACAFAAGCTVIVKAHPAHAHTSELVAGAIRRAAALYHLPPAVFVHVHGRSNGIGRAIVEHPGVAAVGFTGSFQGGKQLSDWAAQRKVPIPVFAEMSSINPVFILPRKLESDMNTIVEKIAASVTLSAGQFCTNPGLLVATDDKHTATFINALADKINGTTPAVMLHPGIFKNYVEKRANALAQNAVEIRAVSSTEPGLNEGAATLAVTDADTFLSNPLLHGEVFGPYTLLVKCRDAAQVVELAAALEGQLTSTLIADEKDLLAHPLLEETVRYNCGRLIWDGVPTGVEVCLSMQHGGPWPATTDSRFTAVGADGIRRFVRPVSFQGWPDHLLPDELRDVNSTGMWRTMNNRLTDEPV
ncbi:MAG: aldehyde dehydrogenase (NADP(+)) [Chitinophagaceae bacterium]|nr:MAG: aldehyde dehydrogenase (NADP(+)) [Chitinophagaceae bacterium]